MMQINPSLIYHSLPYVLSGLPYTIGMTILAFFIGNLLALLLLVGSLSTIKPIHYFVRCYVSFFRGIPVIVLLFFFYFVLSYSLFAILVSILCFSISSSAFLTEIYRGAILSVDAGQWDAGRALGLSHHKTFFSIILPQAYLSAIPALGNVAIDLLKATSITAMISVPEMFQRAKIIGGRDFDYMSMYALVGIIYWILCLLIGKIQKLLEKALHHKILS